MDDDKELMKGSIDILILSLLAHREMYGYEMAKRIRQQSRDSYEMGEGTLYPALKRLENKGWLTSRWKETDGGKRRRYYSITEDGRKALTRKLERWHFLHRLILQVSREVHS